MYSKYLKVVLSFFLLIFCSSIYAQNSSKEPKLYCKSTWEPQIHNICNFQKPTKSWFFQSNIGVGFLYFAGVKGSLEGIPTNNFAETDFGGPTNLKYHLSYNRSALFEYLLGHRFTSYFKLALSYQFQGQVNIQSLGLPTNSSTRPVFKRFSTNWSVNAIMAKFYLESPLPLVWLNGLFSPYLAAGVGPAWQTNSNNILYRNTFTGSTFDGQGRMLTQRLKVSANCALCLDAGFRVQPQNNPNMFSIVSGCKFNLWGQIRNIGKMSQTGIYKIALASPVRVRSVYSFAPYLGLQWNFPAFYDSKTPYLIMGKNPRLTEHSFIANVAHIQRPQSFYSQFNVGVGFLYFNKVSYNFDALPPEPFFIISSSIQNQGSLRYNRTPLFEWSTGYQFANWIKSGLSYQYQTGVSLNSSFLHGASSEGNTQAHVKFVANLMLNSFMLKTYFQLPYPLIWANFATSPYLGVGVGPAWQTWNKIYLYRFFSDSLSEIQTEPQPLRSKTIANCAWSLDAGFKMQGVYPSQVFSVVVGCKYNQWGQTRNIGLQTQQDSTKFAINRPFTIKTLYSFAPYIGAQFNFNSKCICNPQYNIRGKSPNTWKPFWVKACTFEKKNGFWTQFNVGAGFLYFDKVQGNIMGKPNEDFLTLWANAPLNGRLKYNRSPLFEYQLGYKYFNWLRSAISYQNQSSVEITTKHINSAGSSGTPNQNQFSSMLSLNSIMLKCYFELPYPMIWKNLAMSPYLALGVGPAWQSWTNIGINRTLQTNSPVYFADVQPLHQKISSNCAWMVDVGFRTSVACPQGKFSFVKGIKYNQWGQARSIGKITQQNTLRIAITKPITIKTIYSFAPYFGFQWNF